MNRTSQRTLLLLLLSVIGLVSFLRCYCPAVAVASRTISGVRFDSHSSDPRLASIKEFHEKRAGSRNDINISCRFKPHSAFYPNVFQTDSGGRGIRLELYIPSLLSLIIGSNTPNQFTILQVTDHLTLDQWHDFDLAIDTNNYVRVLLDGRKVIDRVMPELNFKISNIEVGAALDKERRFDGAIDDFAMAYTSWGQGGPVDSALYYLALCLGVLCFFLISWNKDSVRTSLDADIRQMAVKMGTVTPVLGLGVLAILAGLFLGKRLPFFSTWGCYLFLGLAVPVAAWLYFKVRDRHQLLLLPIPLAGLAVYLKMIVMSTHQFYPLAWSEPMSGLIGMAVLATVWQVTDTPSPIRPRNGIEQLCLNGFFLFLALGGWCALFQLPNWSYCLVSLHAHPAYFSAMFGLVLYMTLSSLKIRSDVRAMPWVRVLLVGSACVVFVLLGFRSDALFIGGSEYHWSYYTGPIHAVKAGAWLLWDVSSQYGFWNILTAALVPAATSWQALYLLQGSLLVLASFLIFKTIMGDRRIKTILFAAVLTIAGLFFADPALIGPAPYPSSSVMRFFWCYVFLFFIFQSFRKSRLSARRFAVIGGMLWVPAFFWSAESAYYSSLTFLPALVLACVQERKRFLEVIKILVIPAGCLGFGMLCISLFYKLRLGSFPDWRMFIEYALSYAGGFGGMLLLPFGSVWVLLLIFFGLWTCVIAQGREDWRDPRLISTLSALGCLWAIASYFVGRSVPNNITAILPLLSLIIMIGMWNVPRLADPALLFRLTSVPVLILILMTFFGNADLKPFLLKFKTLSRDVTQGIRPASESLQVLIEKAGLQPDDPVVFDGSAGAPPRWKKGDTWVVSEAAWLPTPVQLLEEPIAKERRRDILARFLHRRRVDGYFIQAKGPNEPQTLARAPEWYALIEQTHAPAGVYENDLWKITRYRARPQKTPS